MTTVELRAFSDYHHHLRQDEMIGVIAPHVVRQCGRVLAMPNLLPPVKDAEGVDQYRHILTPHLGPTCEPVMTIKLLPTTEPEDIMAARMMGCRAMKIYPLGVTSHSHDGIPRHLIESLNHNPKEADEYRFLGNLAAAEQHDMMVLWHGEMPDEEVFDREPSFIPFLEKCLVRFPQIRMVAEHITTEYAVQEICRLNDRYPGRIAATITPHHLVHTHTDFCGGLLRPHLHCMPTLKNESDRRALVQAAISGLPCFFAGTDSAPHYRSKKECDHGCAGVWNIVCAIETYAEVFEQAGALGMLQDFTSTIGDRYYGYHHVDRIIRLVKEPWEVPSYIEGFVPYRAGETVQWRIES